MPDVQSSIDYLAKLKLYETEKPYYCMLAPHDGFDPDAQRLDNLEFETHSDITFHDMRPLLSTIKMEDYGFQVVHHSSSHLALDSREDCKAYQAETEELLGKEFRAEFVKCYELRKRENVPIERDVIDYSDPLMVEGPAKGAHNGEYDRVIMIRILRGTCDGVWRS
jgi:hypothetical protein